mmetsp:Transcript_10978/g.33069  ORF Transcript_10978/g.33069 Transcript_10978/m.33069 type:complete len:196 (+) Transcript_10978:2-589(+)
MRACIKETGSAKLFSANITADDPAEMIARGKYILGQFSSLAKACAYLVDSYVAGGTAGAVAHSDVPTPLLHRNGAGHGAGVSPLTQRSHTAFVHITISRVIGTCGIHIGAMSFGEMEGGASDEGIAYMPSKMFLRTPSTTRRCPPTRSWQQRSDRSSRGATWLKCLSREFVQGLSGGSGSAMAPWMPSGGRSRRS